MFKIIFFILSIFILFGCSFDNKTGIWTGSNKIVKKDNDNVQNLELIFEKKNSGIKTKELSKNQKISLTNPNSFSIWDQRYQNYFNNLGNLSFFNEGNYKKLSKISKVDINDNILFYNGNLFFFRYSGQHRSFFA